MNRCFLILLFVTVTFFSFGQNCLPSGITFLTQAEVDAFPTNYPNCIEIDGTVTIGNTSCFNNMPTDINNLDSLAQITTIHASLTISFNPNLIDLLGLENLNTIDGNLSITCNDNLINLNGLNNLSSVGGEIRIGSSSTSYGNNNLENLIGLSSINNPYLFINNNPSFKNFIGINSATNSLQSLWVLNNDSLENFTGLENVLSISGLFEVTSNDSDFDFTGLENLSTIGSDFIIWENGNQSVSGFTSLTEIQGDLDISECNNLADLSGFSNLTSAGSINIWSCPLPSLVGLHNVANFSMQNNFNSLVLFGNTMLSDISQVASLDTAGINNIFIYGNPMLSDCAIEPVCNLIESNPPNGVISIENNMNGCNTVTEVETACSTLPVVYSNELNVRQRNKQVILEFSAIQQLNNSHFEILHSIDGIFFTSIGTIKGESNSSIEKEYLFIHEKPKIGKNYYRIKQVDLDGHSSLGRISSVLFKGYTPLLIYPNPAKDFIFNNNSEKKEIKVYTIHGRLVLQDYIGQNGIDISDLDNGVYIYSSAGNQGKFVIID